MTVINMALFFERFVKTTMSAFFILHQFLGTVQQTVGGNDGSNSNSESGEGIDNTHELLFGSFAQSICPDKMIFVLDKIKIVSC